MHYCQRVHIIINMSAANYTKIVIDNKVIKRILSLD